MTVVRLRATSTASVAETARQVARAALGPEGTGGEAVPVDLSAALVAAETLGRLVPRPGQGRTIELWEALATLGALDLTLARVAEPHLDALAILGEAGRPPGPGGYGVFAAEAPGGPSANLRAMPAQGDGADGWHLTGTKPWCSLAGHLHRALVTAWTASGERALFDVDLHATGVRTHAGREGWVARGLAQVSSHPVRFERAPATPVGAPGWYLRRPGFAWGGVGVAAIWFGAAVALGRTLRAGAVRREPDQVALMHLGAVDVALTRARTVLLDAAQAADAPDSDDTSAALTAARARQVVADTVEEVLARVGHATGPAPLTQDEEHARRAADLSVYVRQHHAERDQARLGEQVLGETYADAAGWTWW